MRRILVRAVATAAAALLLVTGLLTGPQRAAACACGAVVSEASVTGEVSILAWDGSRQSIDLRMLLDDATPDAGWIMPTPVPADISLGADEAFPRLARASAPKIVVKRIFRPSLNWFFGAQSDAGATGEVGAEILRTTTVGPFTVTALTGTDAQAVNQWLEDNDYPTRDDLVPAFQQYLDEGWVLQAVKLTPGAQHENFRGALPTLRMTFATTELVYPLRLSAHAEDYQEVRLYVLAEGPMAVAQQAGPTNEMELLFSGAIPNEGLDNPLLSGSMVHLTTWQAYYDPADITEDITFTADPGLADFQRETIVYDNLADGAVTLLLMAVLLAAPVLVIALIVRRVSRRATRQG